MTKAIFMALLVSGAAQGQCKLGPLREVATPEPLEGRPNDENLPWAHLALLVDHGTENATLIDPLDPRRFVGVGPGVALGVFTPRRAVALAPYDGRLFVGARAVYRSETLLPLLDAADGKNGETWIGLVERPSGLRLLRVDGAGRLAGNTHFGRRNLQALQMVRLADGRLALAYVTHAGGRRYQVTSLWLQWVDASGVAIGAPQRLDGVTGEQTMVEVALAPSGTGVVAAWNPIARMPAGRAQSVPIEVRAFHVEATGARLTRRDALFSAVWTVAGSAGGYLPNLLQAAVTGKRAVLTWVDAGGDRAWPLMAAPAEGGAASVLGTDLGGKPLLRTSGAEAVLVFWDRNAGKHKRASLLCSGTPSPSPPPPLDPLPEEPKPSPLAPADLDRAWQHLLAVVDADAKAKLLALAARERAELLAKLGEDRGECRFECVMAAGDEKQLDACDWP